MLTKIKMSIQLIGNKRQNSQKTFPNENFLLLIRKQQPSVKCMLSKGALENPSTIQFLFPCFLTFYGYQLVADKDMKKKVLVYKRNSNQIPIYLSK